VRSGTALPAFDTTPPRPTAQLIDFQAARHRAGKDPAPVRAFTVVSPPALTPNEQWAYEALAEHLAKRQIAMPDEPVDTTFADGRFNLAAYVAAALPGAPIVLALPAPRAGLVARLFGGAL
jgi:hypothetical protein